MVYPLIRRACFHIEQFLPAESLAAFIALPLGADIDVFLNPMCKCQAAISTNQVEKGEECGREGRRRALHAGEDSGLWAGAASRRLRNPGIISSTHLSVAISYFFTYICSSWEEPEGNWQKE